MKPRSLIKAFIIFSLALFALSPTAEAAVRYSKATKAGKAHAPSCGKGTFFDIKGQCWKCPKGFKHDNILLAPTHKKVCKKTGKTIKKKAKKVGSSSWGKCKKGWISLNNAKCYKCSKGYKHNKSKFGNQKGVCYKKYANKYSKASKKGGSLVCKKGFFDPIDKGSCWTCPAKYPTRTLKSVKSAQACQTAACGSLNGRPCLITERFPSCNKGLAEDFIKNKCVKGITAVQVCKAVLTAFKAGTKILSFNNIARGSKSRTQEKKKSLKNKSNKNKLMDATIKAVGLHKAKIPELKRLVELMQAKKKQVKALFEPDSFCNGSIKKMNKKLAALGLRPNFKVKKGGLFDNGIFIKEANAAANDHFFMSYSFNFGASAGLGVSGALTIVTDYLGKGGGYFSIGPQFQGNVAAGAGFGVQFFPATNLKSFSGWGWGVGASGGPPTKIFSAGIDTSWGETLYADFQGFGVNISVGAGVLPVDAAIASSHSVKLW